MYLTITDDNAPGLWWCATESNLFTVVACMPALHAIFHKFLRNFRDGSSYASRGQYGYGHSKNKGSYIRHESDRRINSLPFGAIKKSTNVDITRTERSDSGDDVELVIQSPRR